MKTNALKACLVIGSALGIAWGASAETVITIQATGVAVIDLENHELPDGSIVQHYMSRTVWTSTAEGTAGESNGVLCYGLGKITAEGVYSGDAICNEIYSAEDNMVTSYKDNAEGGDWVVIGGTGKYKGATGQGRVTYTWGDAVFGDKITMTNEGTITLP